MSRKITIRCGETDYPCYPTMGAAVKFKDLTGHDIEEMKGTSDFAKYIYCCAMSAYKREKGEALDLTLEDFCDGVLIEDLNALNAEMTANGDETSEGAEKKI